MTDFKYKVVFSRRKSISIIVSPDKDVTVRAPNRTSLRSVEEYVLKKSGWIRKHLDSFSELKRIRYNKKYIDGEIHLFQGRALCYNLYRRHSGSVFLEIVRQKLCTADELVSPVIR